MSCNGKISGESNTDLWKKENGCNFSIFEVLSPTSLLKSVMSRTNKDITGLEVPDNIFNFYNILTTCRPLVLLSPSPDVAADSADNTSREFLQEQ
jgi:hypothetical protein